MFTSFTGSFRAGRRRVSAEIVRSNLSLYLDAANLSSYPGSGTTWSDLSGNGFNYTLNNGTTYSNDTGGIISFDGANDFASGPNTNLYSGNMTVEVWIKIDSTPLDWVRIVGTGGSGATNRQFGLWYSTERRLLWQRYGAADPAIYPTTTTLNLGSWYHVAATTSGSSHVLYLNGANIGTTTAAGPWPNSNESITIAYAGFHTYGDCNIGLLRLYTTGLTESQIQQNYNATKSRFGL